MFGLFIRFTLLSILFSLFLLIVSILINIYYVAGISNPSLLATLLRLLEMDIKPLHSAVCIAPHFLSLSVLPLFFFSFINAIVVSNNPRLLSVVRDYYMEMGEDKWKKELEEEVHLRGRALFCAASRKYVVCFLANIIFPLSLP